MYEDTADSLGLRLRTRTSVVCTVHTVSTVHTEWWDDECETLRLNKLRALRQFRRSNIAEDLNTYTHCKMVFN